MDDTAAIKYWIALKWVDSLGNIGIKSLLEAFSTPRSVFEAPRHMLSAVPGIGKTISEGIKSFNAWSQVDREIELAYRHGVSVITCQDPLFPQYLRNIYDCPTYLYVKGSLCPDDVNLALVGSRRASAYGRYATEKLSRELSLKGVTVVSGMARGIDTAAHKGALAVRGRTIAVLGSGIDVVYPPENKDLYDAVAENGAVVSEFPFGTPPNAPNFPARNRIISGMSLGVVVVEASDKSGSLITARIALEQGREVFAIPGSIDSPGSRGTHQLIKQGATLAEGIDDILPVILPQVTPVPLEIAPATVRKTGTVAPQNRQSHLDIPGEKNLNTEEAIIINLISNKPVHIDTIIQSSQLKSADVMRTLLTLELHGLIRQMPGKMYVREEGT